MQTAIQPTTATPQPPATPVAKTPAEAAADYAQANPEADALVCVTAPRSNKRSQHPKQYLFFRVLAGVATGPLTVQQRYAPQLSTLKMVDLDLCQPLKFHEGAWRLATSTKHTAACPCCQQPNLEVRKFGTQFFVLHCGSMQRVFIHRQNLTPILAA